MLSLPLPAWFFLERWRRFSAPPCRRSLIAAEASTSSLPPRTLRHNFSVLQIYIRKVSFRLYTKDDDVGNVPPKVSFCFFSSRLYQTMLSPFITDDNCAE